jgi:hypothetical protein
LRKKRVADEAVLHLRQSSKKIDGIVGRELEVRRTRWKCGSCGMMENFARKLARLKRQGKDKSEEYKAVLESYMRHSCALMCEKYERVSRSALVEMKGIVMMLKVLPDVLLQEVYREVLSACAEEPVAISQSHAQVFMHEVPGNVIGQVGLEGGVGGEGLCKLLNIFLKEGLGVLWPRHKYCKIMLLQTDSIGIEQWRNCVYHLDYSPDTLEKIAATLPSMRPVFMVMPFEESGAKLDLGYHGRRSPRSSERIRTKSIRKGSILAVSCFQWHRTAKPSAVAEIDHVVRKGPKRLKEQRLVCSADLRLHICIGPDVEYVNPHEATVAVEKKT